MKNVFIICFLLIFTALSSNAQNIEGDQLAHLVSQKWDVEQEKWQDIFQQVKILNEDRKAETSFNQRWDDDGESWINQKNCFHKYDENNRVIETVCKEWLEESQTWRDHGKYYYEYNSKGQKLSYASQNWDNDSNQWIDKIKDTYTYNKQGNELKYHRVKWNRHENQWVNKMQHDYVYDAKDNLIGIEKDHWRNDAWSAFWKEDFVMENGKKKQQFSSKLDRDTEEWTYHHKTIFEYNEKGSIQNSKDWNWENNAWVASRIVDYNYNGLEVAWEKIVKTWNPDEQDYFPSSRYRYSSDRSIIMEKSKEGLNSHAELSNFPNPFNGITNLRYELSKESKIVIEVYNLNGQKVETLVNETKASGIHTVVFDASHLPAGIYQYQLLMDGQNPIKRKMMVTK